MQDKKSNFQMEPVPVESFLKPSNGQVTPEMILKNLCSWEISELKTILSELFQGWLGSEYSDDHIDRTVKMAAYLHLIDHLGKVEKIEKDESWNIEKQ